MSESFKYVGDGEDSPTKCHFMGQVRFYLNQGYVEVDDDFIIQKLKGNKCFVIKSKTEKKVAPKKAPKKAAKKAEE
tara:strand:+ start:3445 stop:3672 length:228 start_codon:yes stop_codon:yes gene_type:complete